MVAGIVPGNNSVFSGLFVAAQGERNTFAYKRWEELRLFGFNLVAYAQAPGNLHSCG
jgi:hypothetical protein